MNRPDKLGDPSMDEILASIRQIIAEEPPGARSGPDARSVNPLLSGTELRSGGNSPANGLPPPSLDRLSSALRAKAPEPAAAVFPRKSSFEDDLADLIDDPLPASPPASSEVSTQDLTGLDALRAAANEGAASVDATGAAPAAAAAITSPPAARSAGMGAMRTSAFYPPQGFMAGPSKPKPKPRDTTALFQSLSAGVSPSPGDTPESRSLPSAPVIDGFAGISDIAPPEESSPNEPAPNLDFAARELSAFETLLRADPRVEAQAPPASPAASSPPVTPVAVETVRADGFPTSTLSWERERDAAPVETRRWNGNNGHSGAGSSPLDALARGLAAAAIDLPAKPVERAADIPSLATLIAQPLLPATRHAHEPLVRTLEDAVADMLKPLLQQWLADNMPRIIERALRVEAASSLRPPHKPYR